MKLLVIGHGRHGKDTVCDILKSEYGMQFQSSSEFCARLFIFDELKDKYGYSTFEQCYADRHNHRSEWFDLIFDYCRDDPARLGRDIFESNDIYCGLRNSREFDAMKEQRVFDYAVWVDRSEHLPLEDPSSMNLQPTMADYIIDNNGSLSDLHMRVAELINELKKETIL